jgi:hypothetical protein
MATESQSLSVTRRSYILQSQYYDKLRIHGSDGSEYKEICDRIGDSMVDERSDFLAAKERAVIATIVNYRLNHSATITNVMGRIRTYASKGKSISSRSNNSSLH